MKFRIVSVSNAVVDPDEEQQVEEQQDVEPKTRRGRKKKSEKVPEASTLEKRDYNLRSRKKD